MNRNLCTGCKRFQAGEDNENWFCASEVKERHSEQIATYIFYEKNFLHPISERRTLPPEWCEYISEQTVIMPEDSVSERKAVKGYFKF